jgi:hypothetical protein
VGSNSKNGSFGEIGSAPKAGARVVYGGYRWFLPPANFHRLSEAEECLRSHVLVGILRCLPASAGRIQKSGSISNPFGLSNDLTVPGQIRPNPGSREWRHPEVQGVDMEFSPPGTKLVSGDYL